jgi:hypothetical protein
LALDQSLQKSRIQRWAPLMSQNYHQELFKDIKEEPHLRYKILLEIIQEKDKRKLQAEAISIHQCQTTPRNPNQRKFRIKGRL